MSVSSGMKLQNKTKSTPKSNTFRKTKGKQSVTRLPPVASNEGACLLLYHSNHNSDKRSENNDEKSWHFKQNTEALDAPALIVAVR